ncbi:hypothetical protein HYW19_02880 [Candidatus Woesearchaeota archaeon]|nr:hypothetical protein [Candidatus Woesearchaeota archaeon]
MGDGLSGALRVIKGYILREIDELIVAVERAKIEAEKQAKSPIKKFYNLLEYCFNALKEINNTIFKYFKNDKNSKKH